MRQAAGRLEGGLAGKRAENEWERARLRRGLLVEVRRYRGKGGGKAGKKSHRVICIKKVRRSVLYMAVWMGEVDWGGARNRILQVAVCVVPRVRRARGRGV